MKDIEDMTHEEIIALQPNDLEFLVKRDMAEEGVKIIEPIEEPTYPELPSKDIVLHTSGLFEFHVSDEQLLYQLTAIIEDNSESVYIAKRDYTLDQSFAETLDDHVEREYNNPYDIERKHLYLEANKLRLKENMQKKNALREEYKSRQTEYETNLRSVQACRKDIMDVYNEALYIEHARKKYMRLLENDYLPLAEGNREVAFNFLVKAYRSEKMFDENMETYLRENFINPE